MKPTIRTILPPFRVTDCGSVEIYCPNDHCRRFHTEYAVFHPGEWFRWRCKTCGPVFLQLPKELPMPRVA